MTRKDYIKIAAVFSARRNELQMGAWRGPNAVAGILDEMQQQIANILASDNPRFDRDRFHAACEVQQ